MLQIGDDLPSFEMPGIIGDKEQIFTKRDFSNKGMILYLYPRDLTPTCTTETRDFVAVYDDIKDKVNIVGLSADDINNHKKFIQKLAIPFYLLSDANLSYASRLFAVKEKIIGDGLSIKRSTFLVNADGIIVDLWYDVKVKGHVEHIVELINMW